MTSYAKLSCHTKIPHFSYFRVKWIIESDRGECRRRRANRMRDIFDNFLALFASSVIECDNC